MYFIPFLISSDLLPLHILSSLTGTATPVGVSISCLVKAKRDIHTVDQHVHYTLCHDSGLAIRIVYPLLLSWVLPGSTGFLPHKVMLVRLTGDSTLGLGVNFISSVRALWWICPVYPFSLKWMDE